MPEPVKDFREIIEGAQRVSGDLGGLFNASRVAFEPRRAAAPGPETAYRAQVHVFALPADIDSYQDVLDQCLRGDAILRYEDKTFSKEGDFLVAICILVPRDIPRAVNAQEAGDAEPAERPQRLP